LFWGRVKEIEGKVDSAGEKNKSLEEELEELKELKARAEQNLAQDPEQEKLDTVTGKL
jgi:hypothetical protein